ncbi:ATPase AAA [Caballeronia calidae]|uniref:ATPase AAA n=1 Tax=Caballeronia calidae TaxID=1777139 RepID=A0A158DA37_9BURK|nr:hypothetical protein [Caballeronia calidae]SAK91353.1 ATPase AAA [Caballeronia calidae]
MEIEKLLEKRKSVPVEKMERLRKVLWDTLIVHRNMRTAFSELDEIMQVGKPGQLIVLCGPTNAGKTRLLKAMDQMLVADAQKRGLPVWGSTYCRLPSPVRARFDQGETYRRTLYALEEPLLEHKVAYPDVREGALPRRTMPQAKRPPTHAALWQALMNRIKAGHLAVFFDEAGELPQSLKVTTLRETVNMFKQMADIGGSNVVLGSGPEIGPMLWESGQLAARIRLVSLDSYGFSEKNDVKEFNKALREIETKLGEDFIERGTLDGDNAKTVMRKVRGTFGIALDITVFAVHSALLAGEAPLKWEGLDAAVDKRMEEIGNQVDREQALWAGIKHESLRRQYWGMEAAAGELGTGLILPVVTRGKVVKDEPKTNKPNSGEGNAGRNTQRERKTEQSGTRGLHPTKPENVRLNEYSTDTVEEETLS